MIELLLDQKQTANWLYYETGFEQLHPYLEIIEWMESQGWRYREDWACERRISNTGENVYVLLFRNKEMLTLFSLRWS